MKKIAYILAYLGSIIGVIMSALTFFVSYSYYLDQPTYISQISIITKGILIFINIIIIIMIHKLNFDKKSSSMILILVTILALLLPGILNYAARLIYLKDYTSYEFYYVLKFIFEKSIDYFPLTLVLLSGILFLTSRVKRKF